MDPPKRIDAHIDSDDEDLSRDWMKIERSVKNHGFRMGMEDSQEQSLQSGFNAGFREAIQMALASGKLQGGICAKLSYAPSGISKVISSLNSVAVQSQSRQVPIGVELASSPLQDLLSSNSDLISSIPSLLQSNLIRNLSLKTGGTDTQPDCTDSSGHFCSEKTAALEYLEIFPASKESLECTTVNTLQGTSEQKGSQEQKQALSCEHVCNSKSQFWNQLQNFKMEAHSLGILSSLD